MPRPLSFLASAVTLLAFAAGSLGAQGPASPPDPMVMTIQQGATHIRAMFRIAADSMFEADYAYRPTKDVRTFGQLLAHVASTNYYFCSGAMGETNPAGDLEKTKTTRAEIRTALSESFDYCDRAFVSMSDPASASAIRKFREHPMPALPMLNFRNYHSLLHWGNAITYMRLRGKTPPAA